MRRSTSNGRRSLPRSMILSKARMAGHFHEANRRRWDAGSASWAHRADTRGIWKRCHLDPSLALDAAELKWLSDVAGKKIAKRRQSSRLRLVRDGSQSDEHRHLRATA